MKPSRARLLAALVVTAFLGGLAVVAFWPAQKRQLEAEPTMFSGFLEGAAGGGSGDITSVTVGGEPLAGGGASGDIQIDWSTSGCADGETWIYDGANWACVPTLPRPSMQWSCYDDFLGLPASNSGACVLGLVASSGTITGAGIVDATHPGSVLLTTVTSTTARATLLSNGSSFDSIAFGAGINNYVEWLFQVSDLSDGTDTYLMRVGYVDSVNADATDGAYFEYVSGTSANWACKLASASSRTSLDSGVAVAADTWTKLRIEIDAATDARFYIDGVEVCAAIALTNLPTAATQLGFQFLRSAGTASRTVAVDYLLAGGEFTGAGR